MSGQKLFLFLQLYLVPLIVHKLLNSPLSNRLCKLFLVVMVQSPVCVCGLFLSVCVTEVECVREGCQSECLRQMAGLVPETHCFTVVFRGGRKSLDLCCSTQDEAERWVRGLRTLKDHISNMSQKEKLDQYP